MKAMTVQDLLTHLNSLVKENPEILNMHIATNTYDDWAIGASNYVGTIETIQVNDAKDDADNEDICFAPELENNKYVLIGY